MTLKLVDRALNEIDAQWRCPVYAIISHSTRTLYSGASEEQLLAVATELSQVSGGVGLDILSLLMWPNEDDIPDAIESVISKVSSVMAKYQSEKIMGLSSAGLDPNDLLAKAKAAQAGWDAWEAAGEYDRDEAWRSLYRDNRDAWNALYLSISKAVDQGPVRLNLESRTIEVGTVGCLDSREMMSYSAEVGAEWVFSGICLRSVESIETTQV